VNGDSYSRAASITPCSVILPYDFQKLVGALLVGMGYHVPRISPPGPDGGVDVVAYRDPLGVTSPRLKVQVKHRDQKVTVKEVRELEGLLRKAPGGRAWRSCPPPDPRV
jgi:predicted Mrr-cat superfamily restriction endonuclease